MLIYCMIMFCIKNQLIAVLAMFHHIVIIPLSILKIWQIALRGINVKNFGRLDFGGLVKYCHTIYSYACGEYDCNNVALSPGPRRPRGRG